MKKLINEKNLKFVAHVATSIEGFHLLTAVELAIDEWYLGNPINEDLKYNGVAKDEFKSLLFGKEYNTNGKTYQSEIMVKTLIEFFEDHIASKYIEIQKFVYDYLDNLKSNNKQSVFIPGTDFEYGEFHMEHVDELLDLIRNVITDWHFGFDDRVSKNNKSKKIKETKVVKTAAKKSLTNKATNNNSNTIIL